MLEHMQLEQHKQEHKQLELHTLEHKQLELHTLEHKQQELHMLEHRLQLLEHSSFCSSSGIRQAFRSDRGNLCTIQEGCNAF